MASTTARWRFRWSPTPTRPFGCRPSSRSPRFAPPPARACWSRRYKMMRAPPFASGPPGRWARSQPRPPWREPRSAARPTATPPRPFARWQGPPWLPWRLEPHQPDELRPEKLKDPVGPTLLFPDADLIAPGEGSSGDVFRRGGDLRDVDGLLGKAAGRAALLRP